MKVKDGSSKKKSAAWQNSWKVRRKDWIIFLVYTNWIGSCYIPLERRKNKLYNRKKQKEIGQTQKELWIDKKEEKLTFLHSRQVKLTILWNSYLMHALTTPNRPLAYENPPFQTGHDRYRSSQRALFYKISVVLFQEGIISKNWTNRSVFPGEHVFFKISAHPI